MASAERNDRGLWRKALVAAPAIVIAGSLIGVLSNSGFGNDWYDPLDKPAFQPPGWAFGVVWTTLYTMMGIALAAVLNEPETPLRKTAVSLFAAQLTLNFAWSPIFFGFHMIDLALVVILLMLILALTTARLFRQIRPVAGWLLLPYLLWLCLATALNYETGRLNPGADAAPLGISGA
ncbi:TspO/MBR family protein [Sphingomonas xanthus]|uniref:Tryptophan-rich sensory protein n=1 Tax=Sphingomonas xanthus TaxID=2594473 RepID=A0A516IU46_9SPHN|nr:TspO/MBR family protein [Sphingomonas xanthus]QDP20364.1 tryptophan-rich sensory protein [Sphingomonas xanthus]